MQGLPFPLFTSVLCLQDIAQHKLQYRTICLVTNHLAPTHSQDRKDDNNATTLYKITENCDREDIYGLIF